MGEKILEEQIDQDQLAYVAHIASEYSKAKEDIKRITESMEVLKEILLSAGQLAGGTLQALDWEIKVTRKNRTSFDLETAKKVLTEELLKPFYRGTAFDELRVKRKATS